MELESLREESDEPEPQLGHLKPEGEGVRPRPGGLAPRTRKNDEAARQLLHPPSLEGCEAVPGQGTAGAQHLLLSPERKQVLHVVAEGSGEGSKSFRQCLAGGGRTQGREDRGASKHVEGVAGGGYLSPRVVIIVPLRTEGNGRGDRGRGKSDPPGTAKGGGGGRQEPRRGGGVPQL